MAGKNTKDQTEFCGDDFDDINLDIEIDPTIDDNFVEMFENNEIDEIDNYDPEAEAVLANMVANEFASL